MPKFIDPVFAKTSPKRSFSMTENERFGLVFARTGSINSGTAVNLRLSVAAVLSNTVAAVLSSPVCLLFCL